jgi:hypothetical protein
MSEALVKTNPNSLSILDKLDKKDQEGAFTVPSIIERQHKTEFEAQLELARKSPRSIGRFLEEITAMATINEEIAESCIYALPRGGKPIEGPSVRLAEMALSAWGNCKAASRIIEDDGKMVTAQGVFIDFQRNNCVSVEVKRRVTDRNGKRFSDDMIVVTSNAACAIAYRNVVFKAIPSAFIKKAYSEAKNVAIGTVETLSHKRAQVMDYFAKMGIFEERVLASVGAKTIDEIDLEKIGVLRGLATALKDGDTTPEEAFPEVSSLEKAKSRRGMTGTSNRTANADNEKAAQEAAAAKAKEEKAKAKADAEAKKKAEDEAKAKEQAKKDVEPEPEKEEEPEPASEQEESDTDGKGDEVTKAAEELLAKWEQAGVKQDDAMAYLVETYGEKLGLTNDSTVFDIPPHVLVQLTQDEIVEQIKTYIEG